MPDEIYIKCFTACLIGNLCHVVWKIYTLHLDFKLANEHFSIKKYFAGDWPAIAIDLIFSFAVVYVADELLGHSEYLLNKVKILFLFVGFSGSVVFHSLMSRAETKFRQIVDKKTNELDKLKHQNDGT
jgi:hypothetical protein